MPLPEPSHRDLRHRLQGHSLLLSLIVFTVTGVGILLALRSATTLPYTAETLVLLQPVSPLAIPDAPAAARLDAQRLVQNAPILLTSAPLAAQVQQRISTTADPAGQKLAAAAADDLRAAITVRQVGDVVYVRATDGQPDVATWLANIWAAEGVAHINQLYAETAAVDVETALTRATTDRDAAERALETFLAHNLIPALTEELQQTQTFVNAALAGQATTDFALYNTARATVQRELATTYSAAATLDQLLSELASLRTRISQGPDDPSTLYNNQVSLVLLQSRLLGVSTSADSAIQLQLSDADANPPRSRAAQLDTLDATRTAAEQLQGDVQRRITDLETQLRTPLPSGGAHTISPVPPALQQHITRMNQLQSEIAARTFEQSQLEKTRDLAQHAYDLLRIRRVEQQVNQAITGVVAITAPATLAATVRAQQPAQTFAWLTGVALGIGILLGGGIGLLLSLVWPAANSNAALRRRFQQRRAKQAPT
jgi:hypothetical protein